MYTIHQSCGLLNFIISWLQCLCLPRYYATYFINNFARLPYRGGGKCRVRERRGEKIWRFVYSKRLHNHVCLVSNVLIVTGDFCDKTLFLVFEFLVFIIYAFSLLFSLHQFDSIIKRDYEVKSSNPALEGLNLS